MMGKRLYPTGEEEKLYKELKRKYGLKDEQADKPLREFPQTEKRAPRTESAAES